MELPKRELAQTIKKKKNLNLDIFFHPKEIIFFYLGTILSTF